MSWYDNEGKEAKRVEELNRRDADIIRHSNFWTDLWQQIREDVDGINANEFWKTKLGVMPLQVKPAPDVNGYEVIKAGVPRCAVGLRHMGNHLLLDRKFYEQPLKDYRTMERLDFVVNQDRVFLKALHDGKVLDVPEETAQYLLRPIIELLRQS